MFLWSRGVSAPLDYWWLDEATEFFAQVAFGISFDEHCWNAVWQGTPMRPLLVEAPDEAAPDLLDLYPPEWSAPFAARLVCIALSEGCQRGRLATFALPEVAGSAEPMPAGAWRTDDPFLRFRGGHFNPNNFGSSDDAQAMRVMLPIDGVMTYARSVREWVSSLPEYRRGIYDITDGACRFGLLPCLPLSSSSVTFVAPFPEPLFVGDDGRRRPPANDVDRLMVVPDTPASRLPQATDEEVMSWIADAIRKGLTQDQTERSFRGAVPGKQVIKQNREWVRDEYTRLYRTIHDGADLRPGPRPKA